MPAAGRWMPTPDKPSGRNGGALSRETGLRVCRLGTIIGNFGDRGTVFGNDRGRRRQFRLQPEPIAKSMKDASFGAVEECGLPRGNTMSAGIVAPAPKTAGETGRPPGQLACALFTPLHVARVQRANRPMGVCFLHAIGPCAASLIRRVLSAMVHAWCAQCPPAPQSPHIAASH